MSTDEIAVEFARRFRLRPRAAYRVAQGWTQQQAADRINAHAARVGIDCEGTATMTAPRLCELENWPYPARRRPTAQVLALLAAVYACDLPALLDVDDREHLPAAELLLIRSMRRAPTEATQGSGATPTPPAATRWGSATGQPDSTRAGVCGGREVQPPLPTRVPARTTSDGHLSVFPGFAPDGRIILMPLDRRDFLRSLGLTAAGGAALGPLAAIPKIVDESGPMDPKTLDHLAHLRATLADNDNLFGPWQVVSAAQEQVGLIDAWLRHGTAPSWQRQRLLHVQAQFADLLAWLHQDGGDYATAGHWLDRALEWSHRAADPHATVFVLARKSQLAADRGDPNEAIDVSEAALAAARPQSRFAAIAATYSAHGHALRGESSSCLRRYDQAHDLLDRAEADTDPWGQFFSHAYIEVQRAHSLAELGDYPAAASGFRTAINDLPAGFDRDRGVYLAREARAQAGAHEAEEAATLGLRALAIGMQTRSSRIMSCLRSLQVDLAGHQTVPQVQHFRQAMDQLPAASTV